MGEAQEAGELGDRGGEGFGRARGLSNDSPPHLGRDWGLILGGIENGLLRFAKGNRGVWVGDEGFGTIHQSLKLGF